MIINKEIGDHISLCHEKYFAEYRISIFHSETSV